MNPDFDTLRDLMRWQVAVWTAIDAVCVALVLSTIDIVRKKENRGRAWTRWALLILSLACFPYAMIQVELRSFFKAEALLVSLQFTALLLCAADYPSALRFLRRLAPDPPEAGPPGSPPGSAS